MVDDDIIFENIIASILSDKYDILLAESGEDALKVLLKNKPDLILLDIIMPGMDGWETFHTIRGITLLHDVPIAFITSKNDGAEIEHAKQVGAVGYFLKPVNQVDIIDGVERILSGHVLI